MFDPEISKRLTKLTASLCEEIPGFQKILSGASEEDIMSTMMKLNAFVMENPQYTERIQELTAQIFQEEEETTEPDPTALDKVDTQHYPLDIEKGQIIVQPPGARQPMLNPMLQAALAERLQFDGDIPELRSGPLPEGSHPAVPIDTTARNPVAIGWMLEAASEEVAEEMKQLEVEHEERLLAHQDQINVQENQLPASWDPEDLQVPDPQGYQKGQLPEHRSVEVPGGADLALLSEKQKSALAFKALSTTQGRRSAVRTIRAIIYTGLLGDGFDIEVNEDRPGPVEEVPVYAEWTAAISGGSTQSAFSFIDTAAKVLGNRLAQQLEEIAVENPVLEVMPINTVDVRQVGWAARVVSRYF